MPSFITELRALRHIRHPNIAAFHGAVVDRSTATPEVALVLELVVGPSLGEFVCDPMRPRHLADSDGFAIALGVFRAVRHLHGHSPAIVHGDLKPSNILLEMGGGRVCAKLLDFGLARIMSSRAEPLGGSLRWMAPELLTQGSSASDQSAAADVFSYGRVVQFMLSGIEPFPRLRSRLIRECLSRAELDLPHPPENLTALGREWWRLAVSCLQADCRARPDMAAIGLCLELFRGMPELACADNPGSFRIRNRCPGAEVVGGALVLGNTTPWESGLEAVCCARAKFAEELAGRGRRAPVTSVSLSSRRLSTLPPLQEEVGLGDEAPAHDCAESSASVVMTTSCLGAEGLRRAMSL